MNEAGGSSNTPQGTNYNRRDFAKLFVAGTGLSALALSRLNAAMYQSITSLNEKYVRDEAPDGVYWEKLKDKFLFQDNLIMMNNGTVGPMPKPVFNTLMRTFKVQACNPYDFYNYFPRKKGEIRNKLARFINASPDEIVITRNTTEGMNFIANGLDMKEGDEVLMSSLEHPGGYNPWKLKEKRHGITVKEIPLGVPPLNVAEIVDRFKAAITPRTRVISISHTVYLTGLITPLKELCDMAHDAGILVLADSAHGIGMLDLDLHKIGVDFFATSPYKWLGAPTGCGVLYMKKESQKNIWPTIATSGWDQGDGASRFETLGQRADPLIFGLNEALDFQNIIGRKRIERRIKAMALYLKQELSKIKRVRLHTNMDPYLSGGLTAFSMKGVDPQHIVDFVREKYNIVIRTIGREKDNTQGVRVSTHIFVSFKEVDMLLEGIRRLDRIATWSG
jgi:selenocysteine lyase/cysteine desulfurase